jgi:hypothetical protein
MNLAAIGPGNGGLLSQAQAADWAGRAPNPQGRPEWRGLRPTVTLSCSS